MPSNRREGPISGPDHKPAAAALTPTRRRHRAAEVFGLPKDQEPTLEQLDQVQVTLMAEALKPFHDPKLRDLLQPET